MSRITYDELKFPYYTNSSIAVRLPAKVKGKLKTIELTFSDVVYAVELAGLNMLFVSDTGRGKTQLMSDMAWHHFGGDGEKGNSNWADGRPNFEIEDLFVREIVDLSSGSYDSDTARILKEDRIRRMFFGVDEINRAPRPKQNEFFDLADGKHTFKGVRHELGREGYSIFAATANLNKMNGDFSGTSELDRALLNRAHLTFDLDHKKFRPTYEDKLIIAGRKANPRVDISEPNDIGEKILEANREIRQKVRKPDPDFMVFNFLIDAGLDYCSKDKYEEKSAAFPMLCTECNEPGKDFCSLIKGSSERTQPAVKSMAYALQYIAELKSGNPVEIDPMDAALQAFRFTTYHGNLNELIANEEYAARKQVMMDETAEELKKVVDIVKDYMPVMEEGRKPVIVSYNGPNGEIKTARTPALVRSLNSKSVSFTESDLKEELKAKGVGTGWIDPYVRYMKKIK